MSAQPSIGSRMKCHDFEETRNTLNAQSAGLAKHVQPFTNTSPPPARAQPLPLVPAAPTSSPQTYKGLKSLIYEPAPGVSQFGREGRAYTSIDEAGATPSLCSKISDIEHVRLALATIRWDCDGNIPKSRRKGLVVKRGICVEVCRIINDFWCEAHYQDICGYVPRRALQMLGIYDNRYQVLFKKDGGKPLPVIARGDPVPKLPRKRRFRVLSHLLCFTTKVDAKELRNSASPLASPNPSQFNVSSLLPRS